MHILILGGGIIGLSCAWRLARAGHAVTLLEQRSPGGGATLASLGALWPPSPLANGPLQQLHRRSLAMMEPFLQEISADSGGGAIPFRRGGRVEFITDLTKLPRTEQEVASTQGGPHAPGISVPGLELLSPAQVAALEPLVDTLEFHALHCNFTAWVDVPALVTALVTACRKRGVTIHEHSRVTRLDISADSFAVHAGPAGSCSGGATSFSADKLLIAAGAWTAQLHPLLQQFAPTRPAKGQALAFDISAFAGPPIRHIIKRDKTYLVPWDREILVGSTTEPEAGFDEAVHSDAIETLRQSAIAILPALRDARIARSWAGLRPDAPKHRPILGPLPANPNIILATGHYKTGIGMSALMSELIADYLATGAVPPEFHDFLPRERR